MRAAARSITIAMLLVLTSCSDSDQSSDQSNAALRPFYEQRLDWGACAAPKAPADAQCGTIRVPRDYADPRGVTWSIAVARLPTTGQGPRLGSIVTNPGGPGISGVRELLDPDNTSSWERLRTQYDVVSFDPRGVGSTEPALNCLTDAQATAIRNQVSAPVTAAEQALAFDLGREHALACERAFGDSLGRVGTRDVARDMDVLRAVLGEDKLDYFGFSYGTYLGAVYAELFPGRTDRVVLDSAMNPANSSNTGLRSSRLAAWLAARANGLAMASGSSAGSSTPRRRSCAARSSASRLLHERAKLYSAARSQPRSLQLAHLSEETFHRFTDNLLSRLATDP